MPFGSSDDAPRPRRSPCTRSRGIGPAGERAARGEHRGRDAEDEAEDGAGKAGCEAATGTEVEIEAAASDGGGVRGGCGSSVTGGVTMDHRILDVISSPADLKLLTNEGALHPRPRDTRGDRVRDVGDGRSRWARRSVPWRSSWPCTACWTVRATGSSSTWATRPMRTSWSRAASRSSSRCAPTAASPASRSPARAPTTCILGPCLRLAFGGARPGEGTRPLGRRQQGGSPDRRCGALGRHGVRGAQPHRTGADPDGGRPQRQRDVHLAQRGRAHEAPRLHARLLAVPPNARLRPGETGEQRTLRGGARELRAQHEGIHEAVRAPRVP